MTGKRNLWIVGTVISALSFGSLVFAGPGDDLWVYTCCFLLGLVEALVLYYPARCKRTSLTMTNIQPVSEKEGAYLSVWNLIRKISGSVTAFVVGLVLQFSGFEPNVEQNAATQDAIRYLLALMPAGCYLIGAVLLLKYTFNEHEHRAVRAELDRMNSESKRWHTAPNP